MDYLKLKAFVVNHNTRGKYKFIDNRKNYRKLCLYLIGYKEYLWQDVVPRFVKFLPDDVDVCLISSGNVRNSLYSSAIYSSAALFVQ